MSRHRLRQRGSGRRVGDRVQNATWRWVVRRVIAESGGEAPEGVRFEVADLEGDEAAAMEAEIEDLVMDRKREAMPADLHRDGLTAAPALHE
jgi:hypothetical protein